MSDRIIWTEDKKQFLRDSLNMQTKDIVNAFNAEFGEPFCTYNGLRSKMSRMNLRRDLTPLERVIHAIEAKKLKVGNVRYSDGYKEVRTPSGWLRAHIVEWQKHNGEVPDGYRVCFIDGDKSNINISNLELLSLGEIAVTNRYAGMTKNKASRPVLKKMAKLTIKLNQIA